MEDGSRCRRMDQGIALCILFPLLQYSCLNRELRLGWLSRAEVGVDYARHRPTSPTASV